VLLVSRRQEAVSRSEIFEKVWSDVVVSDGALTQAIRTLRRALGDDVREPVYIRTISRHGYRFIFEPVCEEEEADEPDARPAPSYAPPHVSVAADDPFEAPLAELLRTGFNPADAADLERRREAAESLHLLGTPEALRRLDGRPGFEAALAMLRDARWEVPGSGDVPLLGRSGGWRALGLLSSMRLRRAARQASARWGAAAAGGALAGTIAGLVGGLVLRASPGAQLPPSIPVALALVGAAIGGLGAAGVGAGLAVAEALARSWRGAALVMCGALGGGTIGAVSHLLGRWTLEDLFGTPLAAVGGGIEGLVIGAAAGAGYALATPRREGGMASPRGARRLGAALVTGSCCALAGIFLAWAGAHPGAVSLDFIARSFQGSLITLTPLARLLGENEVGPVTRTTLSAYEGMLFGAGLTLGLTRRPGARPAA